MNDSNIKEELKNDEQRLKPRNNKMIGTIFVAVGLILIGVLSYFLFLKKSPEETDSKEMTNNDAITMIEKIYLKKGETYNSHNKFGNAVTISIKNDDGVLKYSKDDQLTDSSYKLIDYDTNYCSINGDYFENCGIVYETNKYILIANTSRFIAINEKGDLIDVIDEIYDSTNGIYIKELYDLRVENGKVVASVAFTNHRVDGKVEFVYKVDKITIKEIKNDITPIDNRKLDLSKISTKSFKIIDFNPKKLDLLQNEKTFDSQLIVNFSNEKATIKYKNEDKDITKQFDNVSKVMYSDYGNCASNFYVYIFSDNKIFLIDVLNRDEEINENNIAKEINNSARYLDIYIGYLHPSTCDFIPFWLGRSEDGKYYDLQTNTEYLENTYYYYDDGNNYIKSDKSYNLTGNKGIIKIAFIDIIGEKLNAYIDENDYLYEFDYDIGYKKISEAKVIKIQEEDFKYDIFFANGDRRRLFDINVYK